MKGWLRLHRKFIGWEWYQDSNTKSVFIHLLLMANTQDKNWKGILVKRGQVVIGRDKLAETLGISVQTLRTCLKRLKSTNEITIESTHHHSLVTIEKYEFYNPSKKESTIESTHNSTNHQPTTNQQLTTTKEDKKERSKEVKKETSTSTELNIKPNHLTAVPGSLTWQIELEKVRKESFDIKIFLDEDVLGLITSVLPRRDKYEVVESYNTWIRTSGPAIEVPNYPRDAFLGWLEKISGVKLRIKKKSIQPYDINSAYRLLSLSFDTRAN